MQAAQMEPNVISDDSLIKACVNGGNTADALEVFKMLITACASGSKLEKDTGSGGKMKKRLTKPSPSKWEMLL